MKCCTNCFQDEKLKGLVLDFSTKSGDCEFCNSQGTLLVDSHVVGKYISPILDLYVESTSPDSLPIWDCIQKDWNIFSPHVISTKTLCDSIFNQVPSLRYSELSQKKFPQYYKEVEKVSGAYSASWEAFSHEIKFKNRFFYDQSELNLDTLDRLLQYLSISLDGEEDFFRARRMRDGESYSINNLGAPPPHLTKSGRANPIGIPYLYLSSDPSTAVSEVRPIVGEKVVVGRFRLSRKIEIIDLRNISIFHFTGTDGFSESIKYVRFLNGLAKKMSEPIRRDSEFIDYLPTQYLSEFVKKSGWDGFYFRSSQGDGFNLTVFNPSLGVCQDYSEHLVGKVKYDHQRLSA